MQEAIDTQIKKLRHEGYKEQITFYASNYADILAIEQLTHFHTAFIPFFEQYDNVLLETRTKSANIEPLKPLVQEHISQHKIMESKYFNAPKNTEIAFSLSPEEITSLYEP
jgi:DNA repair photolyase